MKIKVFVGATLAEAMQAACEEFSDDMVILESRRLDEGVEITAAVDYDQAIAQRMSAQMSPSSSNVKPLPKPVVESELSVLKREISELKGLIKQQLSGAGAPWLPLGGAPHHLTAISQIFSDLGLDSALVQELIADLPPNLGEDQMHQLAMRMLAERFPVLPRAALEHDQSPAPIVALIGPAGAGKTSTLVKLAARHIARYGDHSVKVITTNPDASACLVLLEDAGLAQVRVQCACDVAALQRELAIEAGDQLLLIEMGGMGYRDLELARVLARSKALANRLKTYLVLPANSTGRACNAVFSALRAVPLAGAILTRLDETVQLGPVVSSLIQHEVGIAWVSNGPSLLRDLHHMPATELLDRALALAKGSRHSLAKNSVQKLSGAPNGQPV